MPNWVSNLVEINGPKNVIESLYRFVEKKDEANPFSLNKIVPVPKSMNMTSGSNTTLAILAYITNNFEYELEDVMPILEKYLRPYDMKYIVSEKEKFFEKNLKDELVDFGIGKMTYKDAGEIYVGNVDKYGCTDWYSFRCSKWGTKWDTSDTDLIKKTPESLSYFFNTAWSCPAEALCALSVKYPDVLIKVDYADEDWGNNTGSITFQDGNEIDSYFPSTIKEGQEFAAEILGYDMSDFIFDKEEGCYRYPDE